MALITASTARSTAITYNTIQLAATDTTKIIKYNWIFDQINYSSRQGLFQCTIYLTDQGYAEISDLLITNGYIVIPQPITTATPTVVVSGSISSFGGSLKSVVLPSTSFAAGLGGNPVKLYWGDSTTTGGGK